MIVCLNNSLARTVLSVGALALAAVILARPADATMMSTRYQRCSEQCQIGEANCFYICRCIYKNQCGNPPAPKKAFYQPVPTRRTGPVVEGSHTNQAGPTILSTHKH